MAAPFRKSIEVDAATAERLDRIAADSGSSPQSVLRKAVEQYDERRAARRKFREEGMAAWDDYIATGLHLTGDEVDRWLARIESGEDVDPPACHG